MLETASVASRRLIKNIERFGVLEKKENFDLEFWVLIQEAATRAKVLTGFQVPSPGVLV